MSNRRLSRNVIRGSGKNAIERTIRKFEALQEQIDDSVFEDIAREAADDAQQHYNEAILNYAGDASAQVSVSRTRSGGYSIVAVGRALLYLEYGAGLDTESFSEAALDGAAPPANIGEHGEQYSDRTWQFQEVQNPHLQSGWVYKGSPGEGEAGNPVYSRKRKGRRLTAQEYGALGWKTLRQMDAGSNESFYYDDRGVARERDTSGTPHILDDTYFTHGNNASAALWNARYMAKEAIGDLKADIKEIIRG